MYLSITIGSMHVEIYFDVFLILDFCFLKIWDII